MPRFSLCLLWVAGLVVWMAGACSSPETEPDTPRVPNWAQDAVVYQIFPERFRNGDPSNDPTRGTLEEPLDEVSADWRVKDWTRDWYEEADWEAEQGDFYDSVYDRRYGGDLQGVMERLPYLDSLGITAIYFNPVHWARSLHKYDATSYHHVDPHFGPDPAGDKQLIAQEDPTIPATWTVTAADSLFFALLREAHRRNIRVIVDGVFNHTGRSFFAFDDLRTRQQRSPYADWYIVDTYDDPATPDTSEFAYQGWWDIDALPELARSADGTDLAPGPKQYIFDATRRWMDPNGDGDPSDGIDGWRLDVADEVPTGFWADWHRHVRSIRPAAYTVAETWMPADGFVEKGRFSGAMNYFGFAYPVKGFLIDGTLPPSEFVDMLHARRTAHAPEVRPALLNIVDTHDTPRLATMVVNRTDTGYVQPDRFDYDWGAVTSLRQNPTYQVRKPRADERRLQALVRLFQMTYVGIPTVYYGSEAGMWGADDPDDRKPMLWRDRAYAVEDAHPFGADRSADSVAFDADLHATYRSLIALRTEHRPFRRGALSVLFTDDARQLLAYARQDTTGAGVVLLNRSSDAHSVRVPLPDSLRGTYRSVLTLPDGGAARLQQDGTALLIEVPGFGGVAAIREER